MHLRPQGKKKPSFFIHVEGKKTTQVRKVKGWGIKESLLEPLKSLGKRYEKKFVCGS